MCVLGQYLFFSPPLRYFALKKRSKPKGTIKYQNTLPQARPSPIHSRLTKCMPPLREPVKVIYPAPPLSCVGAPLHVGNMWWVWVE